MGGVPFVMMINHEGYLTGGSQLIYYILPTVGALFKFPHVTSIFLHWRMCTTSSVVWPQPLGQAGEGHTPLYSMTWIFGISFEASIDAHICLEWGDLFCDCLKGALVYLRLRLFYQGWKSPPRGLRGGEVYVLVDTVQKISGYFGSKLQIIFDCNICLCLIIKT